MSEWLKEIALKAFVAKPTIGSNPIEHKIRVNSELKFQLLAWVLDLAIKCLNRYIPLQC